MSDDRETECPFLEGFDMRFDHIESDISDIKKALLGNGRPGLLAEVQKMSIQVKVVWGVLGALGLGVISLAVRLVDRLF